MGPRLSVLMPTRDRAPLLDGVLDRILEPGLDCELVVLDGGSSDGTWARLQARAVQDPRLRPVQGAADSLGEAYARLLQEARGPYVALVSDVDRMLPGGFARKAEVLDAEPATGLVFSPARCCGPDGGDLGECAWSIFAEEDSPGREDFFEVLFTRNFVPLSAALFRLDLIRPGSSLRDLSFGPSGGWPFLLDVSRKGRVAFIRRPTVSLGDPNSLRSPMGGMEAGAFIELSLGLWRKWMVEADPPHAPSAQAWKELCQHFVGSLQETYAMDPERIQRCLGSLLALRKEHESRMTTLRLQRECLQPEAFLLEAGVLDDLWVRVARIFLETFGPEDRTALIFLAGSPGVAAGLRERLAPLGGPGRLRVLEPQDLLDGIRPFPHVQWITDTGLRGRRGERLAAALAVPDGEGRP